MNIQEINQQKINENKKNIFSALSALNVEEVNASYSGYGDSGSINDITFWVKNKKTGKCDQVSDWKKICGKIPSISINLVENIWVSNQYETQQIEKEFEIYEAVETYLYQVLELKHPGWEIDAGSNGDFEFKVAENKINWNHCMMVEEHETSTL
jgi:hypothetical protein